MILEGIVTSLDPTGELNVAPMGPIVDETFATLVLRPFRTSQTYQNLKVRPAGVFHVVDDVLLLARAAIGELPVSQLPVSQLPGSQLPGSQLPGSPETFPAVKVDGRVLSASCRWHEFEIDDIDDSQERVTMRARVVHSGRLRDFFGFNRGKHAVLEAAILATRVHLIERQQILDELAKLHVIVQKTGGPQEHEAFELLERYVGRATGASGA